MREQRRRNVIVRVGALLLFASVVFLASVVVQSSEARSNPWHGRESVQPVDATLDSLGPGGEHRATRRLYEEGWWSMQATPDGIVMVHRR